MKFIVLVTCALHSTCPITGTLKQNIVATNEHDCKNKVLALIETFGFKPHTFHVTCERQ